MLTIGQRCHDVGTMSCQRFIDVDYCHITSQLTVSWLGHLGWFRHCHLVEVGVGSMAGSSGRHPSNREGQCHETNDRERKS